MAKKEHLPAKYEIVGSVLSRFAHIQERYSNLFVELKFTLCGGLEKYLSIKASQAKAIKAGPKPGRHITRFHINESSKHASVYAFMFLSFVTYLPGEAGLQIDLDMYALWCLTVPIMQLVDAAVMLGMDNARWAERVTIDNQAKRSASPVVSIFTCYSLTATRAERGQRRAGWINPEILKRAEILSYQLADKLRDEKPTFK
ncbi:hypothetical protein C8J56DRAFT_1089142 [Mycena floridula]|nr:hypothetical protein C8J56DRAFT_1089142 [Mycena floridula]